MQAKRELREKARELRQQGMSVRAITQALSVSKASVSVWVRDITLTKQQKAKLKAELQHWGAQNKGAQTNRAYYLAIRKTWQEEGRERARNGSRLHLTGCMLYWAEGAKIKRNSVHFANSDPHMLQLFMRFLREEFQPDEAHFRLQIHCHTHDPDEQTRIAHYWANLLNLPLTCLNKIQVKKGSDTRKNRLENGVCALQLHNSQIIQHIYGAIQEYGGFDNPAWLG